MLIKANSISVTQDVVLQGFHIPANSIILPHLDSSNHSAHWGDPFNFRPERFLDESGTKVIRQEHNIPFSMGKKRLEKTHIHTITGGCMGAFGMMYWTAP